METILTQPPQRLLAAWPIRASQWTLDFFSFELFDEFFYLFSRRPVREENDFFNQKQQQQQQHRRGPTKEIDFDRGWNAKYSQKKVSEFLFVSGLDDGGIYKNRSNFRERPREIDENYETKVDLPVNHREAEIVDEENFYGNVGVSSSNRWKFLRISSLSSEKVSFCCFLLFDELQSISSFL